MPQLLGEARPLGILVSTRGAVRNCARLAVKVRPLLPRGDGRGRAREPRQSGSLAR